MQRNWALYSAISHRRAALIEANLPKVSARAPAFGTPPPETPLGSWTLLDGNTLLAAATCSCAFPNGEAHFVEDHTAPPSRAYLKLWEAFTLLGIRPQPGETCLDLGASPGGWTWVLQALGARVLAVDKAPLDPRVATLPGIEIRQESAFAQQPAAGTVRNFLCTIKFQGDTDFATQRRFAAIPGSRLMHLHANKHELTWVHSTDRRGRT
jgi:23S rRNA (cytidine2498-2'-O)-methyltransferase